MKDSLKKAICENIRQRLPEATDIPAVFKSINPEEYWEVLLTSVYRYTKTKPSASAPLFSSVICGIGKEIFKCRKMRPDTRGSAHLGAFLLYAFEANLLVEAFVGTGKNNHWAWFVRVLEPEIIGEHYKRLSVVCYGTMPSSTPEPPWNGFRRGERERMIKTQILEQVEMTPTTHPLVFSCINRAEAQGWTVNNWILREASWALKEKEDAFKDIWRQTSPEAKASKKREAEIILRVARKNENTVFYHRYFLDFRGRKYPKTAYMHEQGIDLSKGLLLSDTPIPMGTSGFKWLLLWLAATWAGYSGHPSGRKTDKLKISERLQWATDNEELFLLYGQRPKINKGWMDADKPWQFLAACRELYLFRVWQTKRGNFNDFSYPSKLFCYIDGSTNGSQHLAALTRDEGIARFVNLVPSEYPGDLYEYVAVRVWEQLALDAAEISEDKRRILDAVIDTILYSQEEIVKAALNSEERAAYVKSFQAFRTENRDLLMEAAPLFWLRIEDAKERRKVVKR
jgi:hypothetical protein